MDNWLWAQENAAAAADQLGRFVRYIHVKAAVPHGDRFRAIALDEANEDWRQQEGDDLLAVTRYYVTLLRNL
ncbi:xylose isomerase|nr:xylose isomerase [Candidatus Pantoea persica]